ncbi:hypothetical protein KSP39_PZI011052 [Platanthera zijinensis]|uniref:Retrovirus-related Pol polyprotein from transposon TNT 1-94-like beta-barrel domain-containing protein n=1 Tax=Platanthera zijinensis TaxID=2320716 RepID=A0AAP0BIG4_9ASPA
MTWAPSSFTSYTPLSGGDKVITTNGSFSSIVDKGVVLCSPIMPLTSVLHVPTFPRNLLSINRLSTPFNCFVMFLFNGCVSQDLATKQRIGSGRNCGGLYILDHPTH